MTDEKQTVSVDQLEFREITFPTSAKILEMLTTKEAVHPIGPAELIERRLAPNEEKRRAIWGDEPTGIWDKHAYGLFAPGREVPEAVVYVKLMRRKLDDNDRVPNRNLTGNIRVILEENGKAFRPDQPPPNTAIFYSITNAALIPGRGLDPNHPVKVVQAPDGTKIGDRLIRSVAAHLDKQYGIPALTTLSPLRQGSRSFRVWLESALKQNPDAVLTATEKRQLLSMASGLPSGPVDDPYRAIQQVHTHYVQLGPRQQDIFAELMRDLGVHYLAEAKAPPPEKGPSAALDGVANFHLSNGASLANIHYHPFGSSTEREDAEAFGLMANYRYEPELLDTHKSAYQVSGRIVMDGAMESRHRARLELLEKPGSSVGSVTPDGALRSPNTGGIGQFIG